MGCHARVVDVEVVPEPERARADPRPGRTARACAGAGLVDELDVGTGLHEPIGDRRADRTCANDNTAGGQPPPPSTFLPGPRSRDRATRRGPDGEYLGAILTGRRRHFTLVESARRGSPPARAVSLRREAGRQCQASPTDRW